MTYATPVGRRKTPLDNHSNLHKVLKEENLRPLFYPFSECHSLHIIMVIARLPVWHSGKESACQYSRFSFDP